jgi:hypothetical protein
MGQTVNLMARAYRGSNPLLPISQNQELQRSKRAVNSPGFDNQVEAPT